jgi:hypothetical protein
VPVIMCMRIPGSVLATILALMSSAAFGQPSASVAPEAFEAASVKSSKTEAVGRGSLRMKSEALTGANVTVKELMRYAYELQDSQLSGPDWIKTEGYDITAKPSGPASAEQLRLMLQKLLKDQFKLETHRETRISQLIFWSSRRVDQSSAIPRNSRHSRRPMPERLRSSPGSEECSRTRTCRSSQSGFRGGSGVR